MNKTFRLAIIQVLTTADKHKNIESVKKLIDKAVKNNAEMIILPEMWNTPLMREYFKLFAEEPNGKTYNFMKSLAKKHKVYLVGGSIPELCNGKIYNISYVFNEKGEEIAAYSKVHLADVYIPGQSQESDTISFGQKSCTFETKWCTFGLGICYDVRFPLQAMIMRSRGAKVLVYPAAFKLVTGPAHYETLGKARALDSQCYLIYAAPARNTENTNLYQSYGNSMMISPNGAVLCRAEIKETILYHDIDLEDVNTVRTNFPLEDQLRNDMYRLIDVEKLINVEMESFKMRKPTAKKGTSASRAKAPAKKGTSASRAKVPAKKTVTKKIAKTPKAKASTTIKKSITTKRITKKPAAKNGEKKTAVETKPSNK